MWSAASLIIKRGEHRRRKNVFRTYTPSFRLQHHQLELIHHKALLIEGIIENASKWFLSMEFDKKVACHCLCLLLPKEFKLRINVIVS